MARSIVLLEDVIAVIYWQQPFIQDIHVIIGVQPIRTPYVDFSSIFFYSSPYHYSTITMLFTVDIEVEARMPFSLDDIWHPELIIFHICRHFFVVYQIF